MNSPYQPPATPEQAKQEYVKLAGVTLKKKNYIALQITIMVVSLIIGLVFTFLVKGKFLGWEASHVAIGVFILIAVEVCETSYALSKKVFYK